MYVMTQPTTVGFCPHPQPRLCQDWCSGITALDLQSWPVKFQNITRDCTNGRGGPRSPVHHRTLLVYRAECYGISMHCTALSDTIKMHKIPYLSCSARIADLGKQMQHTAGSQSHKENHSATDSLSFFLLLFFGGGGG